MSRPLAVWLAAGWAASCLLAPGTAEAAPAEPERVIAVLPLQNRAGSRTAGEAMERAIRGALSQSGELASLDRVRRDLRRRRIRNADLAPQELLREVGESVQADWLVLPTLHDAEPRGAPRMTVSLRLYSGATGELLRAGFTGGSGIDSLGILSLRRINDFDRLAARVVGDLIEEMEAPRTGGKPADPRIGTLALIPFDSYTRERRTAAAETVTEAARASLYRRGVAVVPPACSNEMLHRHQGGLWGGVVASARASLASDCGADAIVTGTVEVYDVEGESREPRPRILIAARLVDADSGKILWAGDLERDGFDSQKLLGLGRVHSRGELARRTMDKLMSRMLKDRSRAIRREEKRR